MGRNRAAPGVRALVRTRVIRVTTRLILALQHHALELPGNP